MLSSAPQHLVHERGARVHLAERPARLRQQQPRAQVGRMRRDQAFEKRRRGLRSRRVEIDARQRKAPIALGVARFLPRATR